MLVKTEVVMKKGFTIVEVLILFVIFLIVAFLVAPLSLDDTIQARNASRWRSVQQELDNIFYSIKNQNTSEDSLGLAFEKYLASEIKNEIKSYRIIFMNGTFPNKAFRFANYKETLSNAVIAYKFFDMPHEDILGIIMYDVNGKKKPNVWGKDVFGLNVYKDKFEPFGKSETIDFQKEDCSKSGTGLSCSNYYLIGGSFD